MSDIIVIEHEDPIDTDNGVRHLMQRGLSISVCHPHRGEALPELQADLKGVIVTGGPQFVTDLESFPYLRDEMAFIGKTMAADIPLLGICLGAQLVAAQLGANVGYHPEGNVALGYYPLHLTEAGREWIDDDLRVLAANAQGFDCPRGAIPLAGGDVFPNQAFRYGKNTMALQFHPEVTRPILDLWKQVLGGNAGKPGTQSLEQLDAGFEAYNDRLTDWYRLFLDRFFPTDQSRSD